MSIEEKFELAMIVIKKQEKRLDNCAQLIEAQNRLIEIQRKMIDRYKEIFDGLRSSEDES